MWRFGEKSDGGDDGYPPGGRGFDRPRGAAPRRAPTRRGPRLGPSGPAQGGPCDVVSRPAPGGSPAFFGRKPEERTPGRKSFFLPGPTSLWFLLDGRWSFLSCLACGPVSYARNGPPPGWAGWEGWFRRQGGAFPPTKPSPWGEGGPAKPGRMRGRSCTQPFLVEKGALPAVAPTGFFSCPVGQPGCTLIRHLR